MLNQFAAAVATGNSICSLDSFREAVISSLPESLVANIEWKEKLAEDVPADCVLVEAGMEHAIFSEVAQWTGPVIPIVESHADYPISVWRLSGERVISINTSAIGGNANLMVIGF